MFFELQHGRHLEGGKVYSTKYEPNEQGVMVNVERPVVESHTDLVQRFGPEKFRRLSDGEVKEYLKATNRLAGPKDHPKTESPANGPSTESEVSKAAKKGAVAVLEPPGKDATVRFPGAADKGLKVYRKDKNEYMVMSSNGQGDDVALTEGYVTKREADKLIKEWTE